MTDFGRGWLVARRELRERSRSRAFRVSLVLMVVVVIALVALQGLGGDGHRHSDVGVVGTVPPDFQAVAVAQGNASDITVTVHTYNTLASGEQALRDSDVDALVVGVRRLEWRSRPDARLQTMLTTSIQVAVVRERAAAAGIDTGTLATLLAPVRVTSETIGSTPGRTADDDLAAVLMGGVLLTAIVIYGNLVLTGVAEEKSSRVVEVLLARVPARALLGGKVVGIGLLGFGQFALTALAALVTSLVVDTVDLPAVSGGVLAWLVVWFVLGYALYAMVYGALGSLASRTEDAQSAAGPVGYVLIGAFWAALLALGSDPDGFWARLLSLFPATAPLAMPGRIALGATAWWEPWLAVLLTLAALGGLVVLAGRIYENAVLHTGARLRLREAWHPEPASEPVRRG